MKRRSIRTAQADRDLVEITAHIAADSPSAAIRFSAKLDSKGPLLAEHPGIGRPDENDPGRRLLVVGNYIILYRELPDGVEILRYLHGRRDRRRL